MNEGPEIARIAALLADTARSAILLALMDGRALTATELSHVAGLTKQTTSSHLGKLLDGGCLSVEQQGRHRYYRLSGPHIAELLESLMGFSQDISPRKMVGPKAPELRKARVCYDHLAGEMGVRLYDHMLLQGWIDQTLVPTPLGWSKIAPLQLAPATLPRSNRPLCRACLDWSHRRHHLAGLLGSQVLKSILKMGWASQNPGSRILRFSPKGEAAFYDWLS